MSEPDFDLSDDDESLDDERDEPEPSTDEAATELVGRAVSADGRISVVIGPDGRIRDLDLHHGLFTRGGAHAVAEAIKSTVNQAFDDLVANVQTDTAGDVADLQADLERMADDFSRSMEQLKSELTLDQQRTQDR